MSSLEDLVLIPPDRIGGISRAARLRRALYPVREVVREVRREVASAGPARLDAWYASLAPRADSALLVLDDAEFNQGYHVLAAEVLDSLRLADRRVNALVESSAESLRAEREALRNARTRPPKVLHALRSRVEDAWGVYAGIARVAGRRELSLPPLAEEYRAQRGEHARVRAGVRAVYRLYRSADSPEALQAVAREATSRWFRAGLLRRSELRARAERSECYELLPVLDGVERELRDVQRDSSGVWEQRAAFRQELAGIRRRVTAARDADLPRRLELLSEAVVVPRRSSYFALPAARALKRAVHVQKTAYEHAARDARFLVDEWHARADSWLGAVPSREGLDAYCLSAKQLVGAYEAVAAVSAVLPVSSDVAAVSDRLSSRLADVKGWSTTLRKIRLEQEGLAHRRLGEIDVGLFDDYLDDPVVGGAVVEYRLASEARRAELRESVVAPVRDGSSKQFYLESYLLSLPSAPSSRTYELRRCLEGVYAPRASSFDSRLSAFTDRMRSYGGLSLAESGYVLQLRAGIERLQDSPAVREKALVAEALDLVERSVSSVAA